MCRDNTETALSNLPLHLPATYEMILALALGVSLLVLGSRPALHADPSLDVLHNRDVETLALLDFVL